MTKLYFSILLMLIALGCLLHSTYAFIGVIGASLLYTQFITMFGCFVLLGIGVGIPIVFLASVLGWVQFALLLSGNLDPHIAKESFWGVLKTMFNKL